MTRYKRLPLETLYNARDLGGIPVKGGGVTRYGVFLRSDRPAELSPSDLCFLRDYGVKMSLDFRAPFESKRLPSSFQGQDWVEYVPAPLINGQAAGGVDEKGNSFVKLPPVMSWRDMYIDMLRDGFEWTKLCMESAASCEGCVHYNCNTGKDRTGIFSALLLSIAGASHEDIAADYCVSQAYLMPFYRVMTWRFRAGENEPNMDDAYYQTRPESMFGLLDWLDSEFGGALGYIRAAGVSEAAIETIRSRLAEG
ncbi:MAG: tyrosine-protein phosphatase [Oscillospiraceae bacterium]|nr:tyrosine-protein phosphatase [Oscillospiraceae bacterium]